MFVDRLRAALIHFSVSAFVIVVSFSICYWLWYQAPLDTAGGLWGMLLLILVVDVVAGPLATLLVYKKGKKWLLFDLSCIALVQVLFLVYGMTVLVNNRPVYIAFVVDDFELVPASLIQDAGNIPEQYVVPFLSGARFIGSSYSDDPDVRQQQEQDELFLGISLAHRPESYVPLSARSEDILKRAHSMDRLYSDNKRNDVDAARERWPDVYGWLPLKGYREDIVVLVDHSGNVLAMVDLRPW